MAKSAVARLMYEMGLTYSNGSTISPTSLLKNTRFDSKTEFANGNGSQQINRVYSAQHTITQASGTLDLDLQAVVDVFGDVVGFTKILAVYLRSTGTAGFKIGGAGSNGWAAPFNANTSYVYGPATQFMAENKASGWAVSAGSRLLRITHGGLSADNLVLEMILLGSV